MESITYLDERYNLSAEEIRICCLYLAQVPVIHMGHFLHIQSRSTIQARTKEYPIENGSTSRTFIEKCAVFSGRTVEK